MRRAGYPRCDMIRAMNTSDATIGSATRRPLRKIGTMLAGYSILAPLVVFGALLAFSQTLDLGPGMIFFFIFIPLCALASLAGAVVFFVGVAQEKRARLAAPITEVHARPLQWVVVIISLAVSAGVPLALAVVAASLGSAFAH